VLEEALELPAEFVQVETFPVILRLRFATEL
jgi:hypothetical protein